MAAGELRSVLAYETRIEIDDGAGNTVSGNWTEQFKMNAQVHPLKGGESVLASRLQGTQPFLVTVRASVASLGIKTDGRLRDVRSGATFNITTAVPRERRDYVDMICVVGGAD